MQLPEPHSTAIPQRSPAARSIRQLPPSQKNPVWQSLWFMQRVPQELPMQTLGAQLCALAARQVPAPSQVRAPVSVAPVQLPGTQTVPAG